MYVCVSVFVYVSLCVCAISWILIVFIVQFLCGKYVGQQYVGIMLASSPHFNLDNSFFTGELKSQL